jgi:hypothetical protein
MNDPYNCQNIFIVQATEEAPSHLVERHLTDGYCVENTQKKRLEWGKYDHWLMPVKLCGFQMSGVITYRQENLPTGQLTDSDNSPTGLGISNLLASFKRSQLRNQSSQSQSEAGFRKPT